VGAAFLSGTLLLGSVPLRASCLYAALSCFALAAAYLLRRPGLLMKRADGRLGLGSWAVYGAFHLGNGLFLRVYRRLVGVPQWHEIVPGLYLGERLRASDDPEWRRRTHHVLDATAELAEAPWARAAASYLCIPLLDRTAPSPAQLDAGVAFIRENLTRGPVYVHCAYGHSRSALFVAAYLLDVGQARTAEEAVSIVQSKRPGAYLNRRQYECLEAAANRRTPNAAAEPATAAPEVRVDEEN
jgi:predicted protein tyrosine phosphatase